MSETLGTGERRFLEAVRDGREVLPILERYDIGYGWAVQEGFVGKHEAFFEFWLTDKGHDALSPNPNNQGQ